MKKLVVILLLLLYLIPTFGNNVTVHYCGGEISSISFWSIATDKCACDSKEMKKDCCQDKSFSFQVDECQTKIQDFVITSPNFFDIQVILPMSFQFEYNHFPLISLEDYCHHPPNSANPPLYILNNVFRI